MAMDVWVQRIFAIGLIAIAISLLFYASMGNDGKVLDIVAGLIIGIMAGLGISNANIVHPETPAAPTSR